MVFCPSILIVHVLEDLDHQQLQLSGFLESKINK